mgnify:CR=1 FL=1
MKAVVMAGGEGSRLRPLTIGRPKPLVPVVNKAVMAHILDLLKSHGITEIVVTVRYMAAAIQDFFEDGRALGMQLTYAVEETPLGTAGSVRNAAQFLDDTFLVISGDALTDVNLNQIVQTHKERGALASVTLTRVLTPLEYGVIVTDEGGMTAHAAIVSRELGIPCVVGTQEGTGRIADGMVVTVDAREGVVYRGRRERPRIETVPA